MADKLPDTDEQWLSLCQVQPPKYYGKLALFGNPKVTSKMAGGVIKTMYE